MALPLGLSDALLDGFVGQFYRETDAVRDLLAAAYADNPFKTRPPPLALPQIVVVGQESSGKSSVLESLAMLPLFPRDQQICTRMPIHLKMRRQQPTAVSETVGREVSADKATAPLIKMRLVLADGRPPIESQEQFTADQVAPLMKKWMDDIIQRESQDAGAAKGVVDHVLEIHVTSPLVPTLDLVDLPGIVAGRLAGEPHDMMEQTRALVEKYLKMPHTLVLAVVPAGERVRNSQAFQLVQQFGLVDRTIGVLTMADRAVDVTDPRGAFAELKAKLDGEAGDLVALEPHGYVAVKNRDTRLPESQQLPLERFKAHELEWFDKNLSGYMERELASSGVLAVKVERMLVKHVKETWVPNTVENFGKLLKYATLRVDNLGEPPQTIAWDFLARDEGGQLEFLRKTFDRAFTEGVIDCVDGLVVSLARALLKKITAKRDENRELHSLLSGMQMNSLVEKMMRRDELSDGLRELVPSAVMSAFLRLSLLAAEALPESTKYYSLEVHRFENLHLLVASSLWEKAQELIADHERLADRMVQAMEVDLVGEGAELAPDFDCDRLYDVDPVVERLVSMLYNETKTAETVPLPLEDYFVPVVASVSARAWLSKPKPHEFGGSGASADASSSLFYGLSASEIRNLLSHAAKCDELECSSQRCAEILRLARHACVGHSGKASCTDCNLLRALTRHHVHVCEHWPPASTKSEACTVCGWHQRLSPASTVVSAGTEPPSGETKSSTSFSIGAAPDSPERKAQRGRRASVNPPAAPTSKSPKPVKPQQQPQQNIRQEKMKPTKPYTPSGHSRPHWAGKAPETGGFAPRLGRRRYIHKKNQYAAPDTEEHELRRLVGALSRFVVAPLVRQLVDVRTLHRLAVNYLTTHPLDEAADVDPSHWFAESCAKERRELLSEQQRLQAACDGLQTFQ